MLKKIFTALFLGASVFAFGQIQTVSPAEFQKQLKASTTPQLLDVRTSPEFSIEHLQGATLMSVNDANFKTLAAKLDKTKPVFVYCQAGVRSSKAANVLKELGFKTIYNLSGGINSWKSEGLTTTR